MPRFRPGGVRKRCRRRSTGWQSSSHRRVRSALLGPTYHSALRECGQKIALLGEAAGIIFATAARDWYAGHFREVAAMRADSPTVAICGAWLEFLDSEGNTL